MREAVALTHMPFPHSWEARTQDPHSAGQVLLLKGLNLELVKLRVRDKETSFQAVTVMAAEQGPRPESGVGRTLTASF